MGSFNVEGILGDILQGVIDEAKPIVGERLKEFTGDALEFVKASLPKLKKYAELLVTKQISQEEFEILMQGLKDEAELAGLTQAGLTLEKIDATKGVMLKVITSIVSGAVSKFL